MLINNIFIVALLIVFALAGCAGVNNADIYGGDKDASDFNVPSVENALDGLSQEHPRIIARPGGFQRVAGLIKKDEFAADWYKAIRTKADGYLDEPVNIYAKPDGKRLLHVSRSVLERVSKLALVYNVEGGDKYLNRAWAELEAAGNFKDWSHTHFLDTAEMTVAFAIGYDWLYDSWNDFQREFIANAIREKALLVLQNKGYENEPFSWRRNNWNQVCNSSMLAGALAVADRYPELSAYIVHNAIKSLPLSASNYVPDGGWVEGPMYWQYGTAFNVLGVSVLESAMGDSFGLSEIEGFDKAALFPVYMTSPTGKTFNFADGHTGSIRSSCLLWFAKRFDYPVAADYFRKAMRSGQMDAGRLGALGLLWYDPEITLPAGAEPEPVNIKFSGVEAAALREKFDDDTSMYLAFKGGKPHVSHGQIDSGTFVFDAMGKRWAMDLGSENYNIPGYWRGEPDGLRWTYYRTRAEGHNTLVINPVGKKEDQDVEAFSPIVAFEADPGQSRGAVDLSEAYKAYGAEKVIRSFELHNTSDKYFAAITDFITPADGESLDIWWFMHTEAEVKISKDGSEAILEIDGEKLWIQLASPFNNASFSFVPAKAFAWSPNPPESDPNEGIGKLCVHLENVDEQTTIKVILIPLGKTSISVGE